MSESKNNLEILFKKYNIVFFVTFNKKNEPSGRYMTVLNFENSDPAEIFFVTNSESNKIKDILQNDYVEIYLNTPMANGYLKYSGRAIIEKNQEIKKKLWHNLFLNWIPEGIKSKNYTVIKVKLKTK